MALTATLCQAEVLQSSDRGGELWAVRQGAELRVGGVNRGEVRVELPPGATIRDLEPTSEGWLAAGRLPAGDGIDLLLIESGLEGSDLLPVPARSSARYRGQPVLFLRHQKLVGLAWAEGDGPRQFEIRAASWSDKSWGPTETVSPRGPGSQVGPAGVVLEDGTWLLVWSAYDGDDSEIVWSRRVGAEWTAPESIHPGNAVPDVTPDVVALDGGALVVWSWFDGNDYRLRSARWFGGTWLVGEAFGGKGSGEPRLMHDDGGVYLLYPSVEPAAWTVLEMDRAGIDRRSATVPGDRVERPLLLLRSADGSLLRWSSEDQLLDWRGLP